MSAFSGLEEKGSCKHGCQLHENPERVLPPAYKLQKSEDYHRDFWDRVDISNPGGLLATISEKGNARSH